MRYLLIGLSLLVGGEAQGQQVRLWRTEGAEREERTAVRVTPDSLFLRAASPAAASGEVEALSIRALHRVEVAELLTQRQALRRGGLRGALVGLAIGGTLVALDRASTGTAIGITIATAWFGAIIGGQQTDSPQKPVRWRRL